MQTAKKVSSPGTISKTSRKINSCWHSDLCQRKACVNYIPRVGVWLPQWQATLDLQTFIKKSQKSWIHNFKDTFTSVNWSRKILTVHITHANMARPTVTQHWDYKNNNNRKHDHNTPTITHMVCTPTHTDKHMHMHTIIHMYTIYMCAHTAHLMCVYIDDLTKVVHAHTPNVCLHRWPDKGCSHIHTHTHTHTQSSSRNIHTHNI